MSQKPAFFINIIVPPGAFDVNITPDKREILLTNQSELFGEFSLLSSVIKFGSFASSVAGGTLYTHEKYFLPRIPTRVFAN